MKDEWWESATGMEKKLKEAKPGLAEGAVPGNFIFPSSAQTLNTWE